MRKVLFLAMPFFALSAMYAGSASPMATADPKPAATSTVTCLAVDSTLTSCSVLTNALGSAQKLFNEGLRFEKQGQDDAALRAFEAAAERVPESAEFSTAREIVRQRLVLEHIYNGNQRAAQGKTLEAEAEYQTALSIDPANSFAGGRLQDAEDKAASRNAPNSAAIGLLDVVDESVPLAIAPKAGLQEFHLRGDSKDLLTRVAAAYGITVVFDDTTRSRPIRFDIDPVDFYTAMQTLGELTHNFWTPMEATQIFIAPESVENHRLYDRLVYRTFYLPGTPLIEMTDIVTTLKTIFDLKYASVNTGSSAISVRGPERSMPAITQLVENLSYGRPQVVLDFQVLEVSRNFTRKIGLDNTPQFNLFNIPASALAALAGGNIQDLINQLIASGGINQAGSASLAALLAQLQNQQNSIFSQPVATFGGGKTLFGLSLPSAKLNFSVDKSDIKSLQRTTMRASNGDQAVLKVGSRYPILNASFAPIFNTPGISRLLQNNTFRAPFPSFNFEDIGLLVKAKPFIHQNGDVTLELEMELRALGTQSFNGIPVISNRQYKGAIRVEDSTSAILTGMVTSSEQQSYNGVPFLGQLRGVREATSGSNRQTAEDELMIIVTPHVVRGANPVNQLEVALTPAR